MKKYTATEICNRINNLRPSKSLPEHSGYLGAWLNTTPRTHTHRYVNNGYKFKKGELVDQVMVPMWGDNKMIVMRFVYTGLAGEEKLSAILVQNFDYSERKWVTDYIITKGKNLIYKTLQEKCASQRTKWLRSRDKVDGVPAANY